MPKSHIFIEKSAIIFVLYHNLLDNDRSFGMLFATVNVPISDWWWASHAAKMSDLLEAQLLYQQSYDAFTDAYSHLKLSETELKIAEGE